MGRCVEELFQAAGAEERCRAPEGVDLTHLFWDSHVRVPRHFLLDNLLREDRGESLGPDRLHRGRIERWLELERQIRHQVVPALGDSLLFENELGEFHDNLRVSSCQLVGTLKPSASACQLTGFHGAGLRESERSTSMTL